MTHPSLKDIFALSADVIKLASEKNVIIGTAESCTGGLISAALTSISGSSACFHGGIIAYDNRIKSDVLGVPSSTLRTYGAVSEQTAKAMSEGAAKKLGIDIAISVTGVAGPGGGSPEKPVGTVWIGLSQKTQTGGEQILTNATGFSFGDIGRNKVRDVTCFEALRLMQSGLEQARSR